MAPPSENHGAIQSELSRIIGNRLLAYRPEGRVVTTPGVVPRVPSADNVRIADLAVTCKPPRGGRLMDAPVPVIEILSPSNADETWANVRSYTTVPSVRDIVVLSSTAVAAEVPRRGDDGEWPESSSQVSTADALAMDSIGLVLRLSEAYRTTGIA